MSTKYGIDSSHGLAHSLNVLKHAQASYDIEVTKYLDLADLYDVIVVSALLHDMCDKKYMNQETGLTDIRAFIGTLGIYSSQIDAIIFIITTMSYSTVKRNGFPNFGTDTVLELAYHIVREADLLDAYDFNRCLIFHMSNNEEKNEIVHAYQIAMNLFENRMFRHQVDGLILLDYSKAVIPALEVGSRSQIAFWRKMIE
jgi:HD superfamily phosphodiesterase